MISSSFVEEVRLEDGTMTITRHDKDPTFIHGKVYKRSFLVEKNIRFDTRLRYHEDGAFNTVCLMLTTPKYIETPLYLWCWREGSVCRNESFVLKTYDQVMMQRVAVAEECERRGLTKELGDIVAMTFVNAFYDTSKLDWLRPANKTLVEKAEQAFKGFYKRYKKYYFEYDKKKLAAMMAQIRPLAVNNGMYIEKWAMKDFLRHIATEVK